MAILATTLDEATQKVVDALRIKSVCAGTLASLVANYKSGFNIVWHNPKLTPQQVFDALGTDAGQFLSMAQDLATLILKYAPATVLPAAPKAMTVNPDGTVTVAA